MHVLSTAGNSCCLNLMTHLAHNILPAQHPLEAAPVPSFCPTLPHPNSRSGGRGCNLLLLQVSIQHSVLTLPFRPDWNCLLLQFWPHPLPQHPVNSPFKLGFYAVCFLKLPLIFPCTVHLETMTIGNFKPHLGWVNQRKACGNAHWAGVHLLTLLGSELSLGPYAGSAKHFPAIWILDTAQVLLPPLPWPCFFMALMVTHCLFCCASTAVSKIHAMS